MSKQSACIQEVTTSRVPCQSTKEVIHEEQVQGTKVSNEKAKESPTRNETNTS